MPGFRAVPGDGSRAVRPYRERLPGCRLGRVAGRGQRRARRRGGRLLPDRGDRGVQGRRRRVTPVTQGRRDAGTQGRTDGPARRTGGLVR
ncbi:hypothetical protein SCOCK_100124 [Actinacidiphila cocklensis]|uniref:Uncharacterized protein n=1 Tax=Actinacidiphila cocklensis TaxID=887465 RepID=A0A9W4DJA3_9ACTN|nr:hypothetical protein SCOCK_100124 [Actinacidiphila cocklensis]